MQKFNINGTNYKIGFSFLAIREFEKAAQKSISKLNGTWDNIIFFWCTVKALNDDFTMTLDEFVTWLDKNPQLLIDFQTANILDEDPQQEQTSIKKKWTTRQIFGLWMLSPLFAVLPVLTPVIFGIIWTFTSFWLLVRLIGKSGKKPAK